MWSSWHVTTKANPISKLPVSDRLLRHLRRLSRDILEDYKDTIRSGSPDEVAAFREDFFREIIGRFFPRTYRMAKGPIFDAHGCSSRSIDCVVCAPNHPLLLDSVGRVTTLLADGVHGAIEVKPDLTDLPDAFGANRKSNSEPEIIRALRQVRSVKQLLRREPGLAIRMSETEKRHRQRVPVYVVSFKHVDLLKLAKYVAHYYREKKVPLEEQLDHLAALNVGTLIVSKVPESNLPSGHIVAYPTKEDTLANLVLRFTNVPGPEMRISHPLIGQYLKDVLWEKSIGGFPTLGPGKATKKKAPKKAATRKTAKKADARKAAPKSVAAGKRTTAR